MTDTSIVPFLFEGDTLIRKVDQNGEPWFDAGDICRALGIKNPSMAARPLDQDEKGLRETDTPGGKQEVLIVSESGLYTIMLRSKAAMKQGSTAHRFRKWVTSDLLPTIRKTGAYNPRRRQDDTDTKLRMVREARQTHGVASARKLWFELDLPTVPEMFRTARQADFIVDLDTSGPASADTVN